jgi:hypothetical protein
MIKDQREKFLDLMYVCCMLYVVCSTVLVPGCSVLCIMLYYTGGRTNHDRCIVPGAINNIHVLYSTAPAPPYSALYRYIAVQ